MTAPKLPTFRQFVLAEHTRLRTEYGCTWAEARECRPEDHLWSDYMRMLENHDLAHGPIPARILDALPDRDRAWLWKTSPAVFPDGYVPAEIRREQAATAQEQHERMKAVYGSRWRTQPQRVVEREAAAPKTTEGDPR